VSLLFQIILGSLVLGLCSFIHIGLLVGTVGQLRVLGNVLKRSSHGIRSGILIAVTLAALVLAHTIQVWIWAISFVALSALPNLADAIYFSLVSYTTLGYGDITVSDGFRVFAAMTAVTGLLNFGLSTAFLVGLFARLLPSDIE